MKCIDKAIVRLDGKGINQDSDGETSVLEKLLKKDRHAAVIMAMDMLMAGVDTVCLFSPSRI